MSSMLKCGVVMHQQENQCNTFKICPNCNYFCNTKEKDKFCPICGEKLLEECSHCKMQIDYPYSKFCKYCGMALRKAPIDETKRINF